MPKFRKRPVVIEAEQWTGSVAALSDDFSDAIEFHPQFPTEAIIQTLEGAMLVGIGDWIIRGIKGEFYPCKPDIFSMTYEENPDV
jgi:hypothetical protein